MPTSSSAPRRHPRERTRSRRVWPDGWATRLPLAFVVLALGGLVAIPVAVDHRMGPVNRELRTLTEPGRGLMTEIHLTLALQGTALHDYMATREPHFVERYRQAAARERAAYVALTPIAERLSPSTRERLAELRSLEARWHAVVEGFLHPADAGRPTAADPLQEGDLYDDLLVAAARFDEAINQEVMDRRARVLAAERRERWIMAALGGVALLAVGAVAWLGGRLRVYAAEAEQRRTQVEQLMESKARLMRGVSHDLKNPLNALDGHAQLLEDDVLGPLTPTQRASVQRIRRSAHSLLRLIEDLLELSRAEAGELGVRAQRTDLRDVIREAVEESRGAARAAGHEMDVVAAAELPAVTTDPERVRQVLGNLLSNAMKYTPPGGVITVRAEARSNGRDGARDDARGRWVAIDVADTGPGIPSDKHQEVFAEFSRLAPETAPGAGLGLAIARRVARLLGGDITLESEPGRGSCFTLWLPAGTHGGRG